jgi:hypothetical protein
VSLPAGVDQGYVLCLVWIALALAFLTAIHELSDVGGLRERIRARTYARLLALNEYLGRQVESQWRRNPNDDIIPDLDALRLLKNRVDRAALLDSFIDRRVQAGEICRVVAVIQIVLAVLAAVLLFLKALPADTLWLFGRAAFGLTTVVVLLLLLSMAVVGLRVSHGQDL